METEDTKDTLLSAKLSVAKWESKLDLVKELVAKEATTEEFELLLYMARQYRLDPLRKQIWLTKYKKSGGGFYQANIFAGRDGFLQIAHDTNQFAGMNTQIEKFDDILEVKDQYNKLIIKRTGQYKATCTIYRKDSVQPFIQEVYENEYSTGQNLWISKPRTMIAKVAESQCLRKAFSISGLYAPEEMPEGPPQEKVINAEHKPTQDSKINKITNNTIKYTKLFEAWDVDMQKLAIQAGYTQSIDACKKLEACGDFINFESVLRDEIKAKSMVGSDNKVDLFEK